MTLEQMLGLAPVVPVLVIESVETAVPLARALVAGGLPLLEVTLRTPTAMDCIARIAAEVEGAVVGAGTVLTPKQLADAQAAGARFAVSPGFSRALADEAAIPLLPGVATPSEAMAAREAGLRFLKLFPAEAIGGAPLLKALYGPLADLRFCPTGGITAAIAPTYLELPNVVCVGGSWMAPSALLSAGDWEGVRTLAAKAAGLARTPRA